MTLTTGRNEMYGQIMIGGICPDCKARLPVLRDNGSWEVVDCPGKDCDNWFDTDRYQEAGGKLR